MKYKCAKCGGVFLQKVTENRNFRNWNIKQRKIDEHNLMAEAKIQKESNKLIPEEKSRRTREYSKVWGLKNKDKLLGYNRNHYWKNHEEELERCRIYREKNNEKRIAYNKKRLSRNREQI
jgi:hypothetical protein